MNGYEFVKKILGHTNYDVTPLIELTKGLETEWLEFKAVTKKPSDNKKNNEWDYRFHASKSLFSMTNSIGGAVIIGVGEDNNSIAEAVSLEKSGFKGDKDKFMRDLDQQVLYPKKWKTTEGQWQSIEKQHNLFKPIWGLFNKQPIIIIFVKPRDKENKYLKLIHKHNNNSENVIFSRRQGDTGQVIKILPDEENNCWKNRKIDNDDLNDRFNLFLLEWNKTKKHNEHIILDKLDSYLNTFKNSYEKETINTHFVPLYAQKINTGNISNLTNQTNEVLELLEQKNGLILLGDPGSGKSTCLHRKVFLAAISWQQGHSWPLLISLHEYTESGLRALILKQLPELYWIDIEDKIARGEIILIFDALNECPTVHYDNCHQEIDGLLRAYPSANIIISSRLTHSPNFQKRLPIFDIRPMDDNQQQQFLNIHINDKAKVANLLNRLKYQSGTKLIASSPVLLKMVVDIEYAGRDLPMGLANLYQSSFQIWHHREAEKNKQNGSASLWSFNRVREALAELSFRMRIEGKVSCNVSFARDSIERVMGNDVARFLDRIAQGLLLEVDDNDEFLHFSHETIQEYLVAEYLANHPDALTEELLQDSSGKKKNNWAMPLVFAFELINNPSKNFLQNAWLTEPLLVTAALRDNNRLKSLPLYKHEDLWLQGVLRVMRNEDVSNETREISYVSHTPPKYPLPTILVAALRGIPFWYSAQSHKEGLVRVQHLQNLIFDRSSMWIELIPYTDTDQLQLHNISPAQQLLMGKIEKKNINDVLKHATVAELCTLLRFKKIKAIDFKAYWESALERSNASQLPLDLIALLRIKAKLGKSDIKLSHFNEAQKERLHDIGKNWKLSFRLLNILVRERIILAREIREESGRLKDIISRMSAMNMFRFMKNRVLKSKDISDPCLTKLLAELNPSQRRQLKKLGCIVDKEVLSAQRENIYSKHDLKDRFSREKIDAEIRSRQWEVTVLKTFGSFGFVKHPRFEDNAIFWLNTIKNPYNKSLVRGDILKVGLETKFNNKKQQWGFAVISGSIVDKI